MNNSALSLKAFKYLHYIQSHIILFINEIKWQFETDGNIIFQYSSIWTLTDAIWVKGNEVHLFRECLRITESSPEMTVFPEPSTESFLPTQCNDLYN